MVEIFGITAASYGWCMKWKNPCPVHKEYRKGCAVLYCATGCVLFGERLLYFWKAPSCLSRGQRYGLHPVLSSWCSLFLRVSWENGHVTVSRFHRPMETQSVKQLTRVSNYELNLFCKKVALVLFSERKKKKKSNSNHFEVSFLHSLGDLACKILIKKNILC